MINPRRRRTVIVLVTMAFILSCQLPNLANVLGLWKNWDQDSAPALARDEQEEQALKRALAAGEIDAQEYQRRYKDLLARSARRRRAAGSPDRTGFPDRERGLSAGLASARDGGGGRGGVPAGVALLPRDDGHRVVQPVAGLPHDRCASTPGSSTGAAGAPPSPPLSPRRRERRPRRRPPRRGWACSNAACRGCPSRRRPWRWPPFGRSCARPRRR